MDYKHIIAFLGKNQMKDWAKPTSRLELYNENKYTNAWGGLVSAHPEKFRAKRQTLIAEKNYPWYRVYKNRIVWLGKDMNELVQESEIYAYDPKTDSIIFSQADFTKEEFEALFPVIEQFIDSGKHELKYEL